ncbi:hypothetical protein AHF37_02466 [Paragonimus kellicotti]|nr:hypothetical protein AHF37_02466 [Paragonimus kellicotti]
MCSLLYSLYSLLQVVESYGSSTIHQILGSLNATDADLGRNGSVSYRIATSNDQSPGPRNHFVSDQTVSERPGSNLVQVVESYGSSTIHQILGSLNATDADLGRNGSVSYRIATSNDQSPGPRNHFVSDQTVSERPGSNLVQITQDGQIKIYGVLDREQFPMVMVDVIAEDNGTPTRLSSMITLTIHVLDLNDNKPRFLVTSSESSGQDIIAGKDLIQQGQLRFTQTPTLLEPLHILNISLDTSIGTVLVKVSLNCLLTGTPTCVYKPEFIVQIHQFLFSVTLILEDGCKPEINGSRCVVRRDNAFGAVRIDGPVRNDSSLGSTENDLGLGYPRTGSSPISDRMTSVEHYRTLSPSYLKRDARDSQVNKNGSDSSTNCAPQWNATLGPGYTELTACHVFHPNTSAESSPRARRHMAEHLHMPFTSHYPPVMINHPQRQPTFLESVHISHLIPQVSRANHSISRVSEKPTKTFANGYSNPMPSLAGSFHIVTKTHSKTCTPVPYDDLIPTDDLLRSKTSCSTTSISLEKNQISKNKARTESVPSIKESTGKPNICHLAASFV